MREEKWRHLIGRAAVVIGREAVWPMAVSGVLAVSGPRESTDFGSVALPTLAVWILRAPDSCTVRVGLRRRDCRAATPLAPLPRTLM